MTAKTKATLVTEYATDFPTNTTGQITATILRAFSQDIIDSWQQATAVNAQTGTTYTFVVADFGKLVTFSNAGAIAVTLPQATTTFSNFNVLVRNLGAGTVTITPTTSTINGAATYTLATNAIAFIVSDGTNYQVHGTTYPLAIVLGGTGVSTGTSFLQSQTITVDFSSAGDNAVVLPLPSGYTRIAIGSVFISSASADISAATFGLFTTTGGVGTIIAAGTAITVTATADNTNNNYQSTNFANAATESYLPAAANTIYFRVGTTAAAGRTGKVTVRFNPLP